MRAVCACVARRGGACGGVEGAEPRLVPKADSTTLRVYGFTTTLLLYCSNTLKKYYSTIPKAEALRVSAIETKDLLLHSYTSVRVYCTTILLYDTAALLQRAVFPKPDTLRVTGEELYYYTTILKYYSPYSAYYCTATRALFPRPMRCALTYVPLTEQSSSQTCEPGTADQAKRRRSGGAEAQSSRVGWESGWESVGVAG